MTTVQGSKTAAVDRLTQALEKFQLEAQDVGSLEVEERYRRYTQMFSQEEGVEELPVALSSVNGGCFNIRQACQKINCCFGMNCCGSAIYYADDNGKIQHGSAKKRKYTVQGHQLTNFCFFVELYQTYGLEDLPVLFKKTVSILPSGAGRYWGQEWDPLSEEPLMLGRADLFRETIKKVYDTIVALRITKRQKDLMEDSAANSSFTEGEVKKRTPPPKERPDSSAAQAKRFSTEKEEFKSPLEETSFPIIETSSEIKEAQQEPLPVGEEKASSAEFKSPLEESRFHIEIPSLGAVTPSGQPKEHSSDQSGSSGEKYQTPLATPKMEELTPMNFLGIPTTGDIHPESVLRTITESATTATTEERSSPEKNASAEGSDIQASSSSSSIGKTVVIEGGGTAKFNPKIIERDVMNVTGCDQDTAQEVAKSVEAAVPDRVECSAIWNYVKDELRKRSISPKQPNPKILKILERCNFEKASRLADEDVRKLIKNKSIKKVVVSITASEKPISKR